MQEHVRCEIIEGAG